jgi:hypothetical protein
MIISSFFTVAGAPAPGLSPLPTISIYSVNGVTSTPVIVAAAMVDAGNGFYQYLFASYNESLDYIFLVDGGSSYGANNAERYQPGSIQVSTIENTTVENIGATVWEQISNDHLVPGTTGYVLAQTKADTTAIANNLYVNSNSVLDLVNLLLEYDTNRTKIDPIAKTLTVYRDDCVTPLRVFSLLDTTGTPSITEVAERKPISATDGLPVCP